MLYSKKNYLYKDKLQAKEKEPKYMIFDDIGEQSKTKVQDGLQQ